MLCDTNAIVGSRIVAVMTAIASGHVWGIIAAGALAVAVTGGRGLSLRASDSCQLGGSIRSGPSRRRRTDERRG